ncbi:hypothetical protein [Brevibacillus formosus]|uniref:hypothetical protein n=1 Tax=Brevibacillus formosus TaxID=54913 RepID=UPI003F531917
MDHANPNRFQKNRSTIPVHRAWTVGMEMIAFAIFPDFRKFSSGFMESSKKSPHFLGNLLKECYWVFAGGHLALFQKTGIYQNGVPADEKSREPGSMPHPRLIHTSCYWYFSHFS